MHLSDLLSLHPADGQTVSSTKPTRPNRYELVFTNKNEILVF
jgi:hypothetical protein